MLNVRLTSCSECGDVSSLIEEIDCKLAKIANSMYNNITLMLGQQVTAEVMVDLLTYKRILQNKYVNPLYASSYTITMITNKVKLLKYK